MLHLFKEPSLVYSQFMNTCSSPSSGLALPGSAGILKSQRLRYSMLDLESEKTGSSPKSVL